MSEADLTGSDLSDGDLHGVIAFKAVLSGVDLSGANLSGADLRGAVMSDADLSVADLSGANLHGADLSGARLENANLSESNLVEVDLTGTYLAGAQLINLISIDGADFTGVSGLSKESTDYLTSIAGESHPVTLRQTLQTLESISTSEMAEDRA